MKNLKTQVIHCLEHYPDARNSDIRLLIYIWKLFYPEYVFGDKVALENLYDLPREDNVKRIRASIQNHPTNPRFLPTDWKVAKQRKINEEKWRNAMGYNPELRTVW